VLTAEQITEWQAYDALDPIGSWRGDFQASLICSVFQNIAQAVWGGRDKKDFSTPFDYLPDWDGAKKRKNAAKQKFENPQAVEEMKEIMMALVSRPSQEPPRNKPPKRG